MRGRTRITLFDYPAIAAATTAIVVPARDEADHIAACLRSLAAQDIGRRPAIYLCVNNTSDDTAGIAREIARDACLPLVLIELEIARGGVGRARRIGHALVARHSPAAKAMLSTDADCIAAPGWARGMEEGLERADAVLGHIDVLPEDLARFPAIFHERGETAARYSRLSLELECLLACTGPGGIGLNTAGGANMGMRAEVYRRLGGFASLPFAEDRDLIGRALDAGCTAIRVHEAVVHASMRTEGRAWNGMSAALSDQLENENYLLDIALAPLTVMLARHLGPCPGTSRMRLSEAERDIEALNHCVAVMRRLEGMEARRAFASNTLAERSVEDPYPPFKDRRTRRIVGADHRRTGATSL